MPVLLGDIVPDFDADTTIGPISFHEWIGGDWAFLFSHPANFALVSTAEMGRTSQRSDEFAKRGVKPIGPSTDTVDEHLKWIADVNDTQNTNLRFPIIADPDLNVARLYGMIHPAQSATAAVRSAFIIDGAKRLRLTMTGPMSVGSNFDEILRVIDALKTSDARGVSRPAEWRPGDRAIIPPSVSDADARHRFPQGFETVRTYLRMVDIDAV